MKLIKQIVFIGFVIVVFNSCQHESFSTWQAMNLFNTPTDNSQIELLPSEYVKWVQNEKNGLNKEKVIDELTFSLQFKPLDYIICQEEKTDSIKKQIRNTKLAEIEDMEYFDLKISDTNFQGELLKYNISSIEDYNNRVKYFAFQMQKDISMVVSGDTIPCGLYHFERSYDITPTATLVLGFPKSTPQNNLTEKVIVFYDKIFDKGIIKFTFDSKDLNNLPKLKTL